MSAYWVIKPASDTEKNVWNLLHLGSKQRGTKGYYFNTNMSKRQLNVLKSEIRVLEAMSDRSGRYTELSQGGIKENSLHGITGAKTLDPKQFFMWLKTWRTVCYLKEAGYQIKLDITSSLRSWRCFVQNTGPRTQVHCMERVRVSRCVSTLTLPTLCSHSCLEKVRRLRWKIHPDELMELLGAVNSIPIASAECECGFSQINLIALPTVHLCLHPPYHLYSS